MQNLFSNGLKGFLVHSVYMAEHDWRLSRSAVIFICLIPFVIPLVTIVAGPLHRPTFDALTGEDQIGEWIQVAAWVGALFFTSIVFVQFLRLRIDGLAVLYGILVLGIVFIAGEEVSWGQRLFDFQTPEALKAVNGQGEATVHNILGVQTAFGWGMFIVGAYGTLTPLWALRRWGLYATWPLVIQRLVPHWLLIPYFLLMLVWRTYRNLFEPIREYYFAISEFGEITELVLALGFLAFAWHQWSSMKPLEHDSQYSLP